jgi:TP901 family phage tail tape measure protein
MADEKIVTSVVATSDFSGLIADVQRTTAALSKLQQELSLSNKTLAAQAGQIQKAFGETLRSTGQFTTHFVTVGSEVENFGKRLDAGKLKLRDYFQTWQTHTKTSGGLIRDLAKQQVALQQAIVQPLGKSADGLMKFNVNVANGLDQVKNRTAIARKEMQIYNKVIQDGGVQLINWGKNTQWAGRQLTVGLTVPLAAFGAAAAKAFREADQELVRLQKVYGGLSAVSAQELAKVRKDVSATAKELAGMYGASYKETIGLAADIAATGKQGNELLQSTKEATRLSILGEVDRQEAMKATLAIQSAFKQNTTELSDSINFLNAVENQTSTSLGDLVEAIPKAGPVVKALGGSIQDLALYLTAMREGGINASEGANALKSALASIINPTKVAKEQFMSFGIDLGGIVTKNAGNLTGTILEIQAALENLDPLKKSQAIEQLFGKFQFARMNALFENLGKQGSQTLQVLDLMKASSQDLAGVAGRELSQITESASGQYKRAIESLRADLAGLGDQFLKISTFFIKVVDGVLKFVNKMPDPIKTLLGLLGGITALAGPLIMLTGVFANFIGYVVKSIGHIRALGKGGEGFKLLTPQILATEQAGNLIEKTFYSDAKAAQILSAAISNLTNEYAILQQKAMAGSISAQPLISTLQGNVIMEGAERVADPTSRYIGKPYSRQMSHTRPVAGMTTDEKAAQNIFGVVPGAGPVNQRIGKNPQMYMSGDLPKISGLTEISGVSTGIVAQEAAKWHSMTAALAMQSEEEIKMLKREVAATGAITTELSTSYQALLPKMTNITSLAAEESALIVADLQASKITVDQARAKVIELNARIEAMMAQTATEVAASQGRTANITTVPLTGQPVVDPVTGKSNMKEMFHKSKTSQLVDKIARSLGVRTSGGGYSIETTKPKRFATGGSVVPGNGNSDTVPAMLTPGEFVINKEATAANLPLLEAINNGQSSGMGMQYGGFPEDRYMSAEQSNMVLSKFGITSSSNKQARLLGRWGMILPGGVNSNLARHGVSGESLRGYFDEPARLIDLNDFLDHNGISPEEKQNILKTVASEIQADLKDGVTYKDKELGRIAFNSIDRQIRALESKYPGINLAYQKDRMTPGRRDTRKTPRPGETQAEANKRGGGSPTGINVPGSRRSNYRTAIARLFGEKQVWAHFDDEAFNANVEALAGYNAVPFENLPAMTEPNRNAAKFPTMYQTQAHSRSFLGMPLVRRGSSFGRLQETINQLSRYQPFLPKNKPASGPLAALPSRFTRKNKGGRIGFNSGGLVPGYQQGGKVSKMDPMMAGFGLQMAGQMIGGSTGNVAMMGGLAMQLSPMLGMLKGINASAISFASILAKVRTVGVGAFTALRGALTFLTGPVGLTITAVTGLTALFLKMKDNATKAGEVNRAMMGGTKSSLKEVGISYTSIADKIKAVNEQLELNRARVKSSYQAFAKSGVPGLDLTLQQLNEGVKAAKKEDKESVGLFNNARPDQVNKLATSMKAQFVSLGMSVQEATNQIYILMKASNKSGQALNAISSDSFKAITDRASAATTTVQMLGNVLASKGLFNAEEFARGLDNMLNSLDAYKNSLMQTTKAGAGLSETQALKKTFDEIAKVKGNTIKLEGKALDALKQQDIVLGSMLGKSETLASVFAKYQLMMSGLSDQMDIAALSAGDAVKAAKGYEITKQAAGDVLSTTKLGQIASAAQKSSDKAAAVAKNAAKADSSAIDAAIKGKQKLIAKLEEERAARLKILDLQEKSASFQTSIQQAQLKYQEALAAGDMAQAAQEQLNIKQLEGDRQRDLARQAINDKADKERKKLEAEIQRLQDQKDAQAKAVVYAQNNAARLAETAATKTGFKSELSNLIAGFGGDVKGDAAKLQELLGRMRKAGLGSEVNDLFASNDVSQKAKGKDQLQPFVALLEKLSKKTTDVLGSDKYSKFAESVDVFKLAVDNFAGVDSGKKTGGTFGADKIKTVSGKTVGDAAKNAVSGKQQSQMWQDPLGQAWTKFTYNGKTYVVSQNGTDIYEFDNNKNEKVGKRLNPSMVPGRALGGPVSAGQTYMVGERGPELLQLSNPGFIIPNNVIGSRINSPRYNIPSNSYSISNQKQMAGAMANVTYQTTIELNGTNVTMDDAIRQWESHIKLREMKTGNRGRRI